MQDGLGVAVFSGFVFALVAIWTLRTTVVSWARQKWANSGYTITYDPVGATCYGLKPCGNYASEGGHYGALGLVNGQLMFATRNYENFTAPLASITWIGWRELKVKNGRSSKKVTALMVHGEYENDWYVAGRQAGGGRLPGARCGTLGGGDPVAQPRAHHGP